MEQLVARRAHNPKVVGSSPAPATESLQVMSEGFFLYQSGVGLTHKNKMAPFRSNEANRIIPTIVRDGAVGSSSGS